MLNLQRLNVSVAPVIEKVRSELTQRDLGDTQNEFWNVDRELTDMLREMTLAERKEVNELIRNWKGL